MEKYEKSTTCFEVMPFFPCIIIWIFFRLEILRGIDLSSFCFQAKNWQKGLELYEDIKSMKLKPTVATMNALITALCKSVSVAFFCLKLI